MVSFYQVDPNAFAALLELASTPTGSGRDHGMDAAMHSHRNLAAGLAESRSTSTPRIAKAFLLDVAVFLCASNDLGPVYKFYTAVRVPSAKAQLHTSSRGATSRGRPDRGETKGKRAFV